MVHATCQVVNIVLDSGEIFFSPEVQLLPNRNQKDSQVYLSLTILYVRSERWLASEVVVRGIGGT